MFWNNATSTDSLFYVTNGSELTAFGFYLRIKKGSRLIFSFIKTGGSLQNDYYELTIRLYSSDLQKWKFCGYLKNRLSPWYESFGLLKL